MEIAIFFGDLDPDLPSLFQGMSVQRFTQIFKELIAYGQYQVEVTTKIDPTLKNQVITRQREIIPVVRFFLPHRRLNVYASFKMKTMKRCTRSNDLADF